MKYVPVLLVIFSGCPHILCCKRWWKVVSNKKEQIFRILPERLKRMVDQVMMQEDLDFEQVTEICIRVGKPVCVYLGGKEVRVNDTAGREELKEIVNYMSRYSPYAFEEEMRKGFLTIEGGHRVGMAGKAITEQDRVRNLRYVSSVHIRAAHEVKGCANKVFPYIANQKELCHTMIISPPGCGKTTLLRDIIRQVSDGNDYVKGCTVGVVDERSEIAGCYLGAAQNDIGLRSDVLDACPKAEGMLMMIRSMTPKVVAADEIGTKEDVEAIEYAMHCGCRMIVTAHGNSVEELRQKPVLGQLIQEERFERYIVLRQGDRPGLLDGIYDRRGQPCF